MVFEESNKKGCCMKVETGTMIFAVINAAMWCLGTCAAIFSLIVMNVYSDRNSYNRLEIDMDEERPLNLYLLVVNFFLCICLLVSAINFVFAVFLCNGVIKKIPSHIKAYLIFGVMQAVLLSSINAIVIAITGLYLITFAFIFIFLYCLVLRMVYLTQVKFTNIDHQSFKHKRLVDTVY